MDLLPRYQSVYALLGDSPIERLDLINTTGKPCTPQYLNRQNRIFEYDWSDSQIVSLLSKDFFGFINTRIVGGTQSSQCSLISHTVDFNNELMITKVNEGGVYKQYCDHSDTYYVVYGEQLTLNVDGLVFVGDQFEFIVYPEFQSVVIESNSDFVISQYRVTKTGNQAFINSNVTGFIELTVDSYSDQMLKINGLIAFKSGTVYKQYLQVNAGDQISIEHVYDDYRYKQFAGIIKQVRWCKL